jgi:hypothetical protein
LQIIRRVQTLNNFGASPEDNTEITMNFNMSSASDGKFSWLEPGDNFLFYDDVQMNASTKIELGGTGDHISLNSSNLSTVASAKFDVDAGNEIILDYGGGDGVIIQASDTPIGKFVKLGII